MAQGEATTETVTSPVCLGVDLGSQYIRIGTVDQTGRLLAFRREPYTAAGDGAESGRALADQLLAAVQRLLNEQSAALPITAIGVGFPGLVHQTTHRIVKLPHAPSLVNLNLYQEFEGAFRLPVTFENNTNAAAFAEISRGVARGVSDCLYLGIGTGIGAGLVLDGKLRRGKSGFAGEIGHINIDPDGIECACGSFGCLETMASAPNIVRRTRARLQRDSTSSLSHLGAQHQFTYEDIITAAHSGDDLARLMMKRTGHFIGMAVADVINLLNLSMVVIGGAPAARPFLVPAITEEASRRAFAAAFEDCQIVAGELGEEAGVIGAALLASKAVSS
jgi:glucokinase